MTAEMDMREIDVRPAATWLAFSVLISLSAVALAMLVFVLA